MFKKVHHTRVKDLCASLGEIYGDFYRFTFHKNKREVFVTTYTKTHDTWEEGSTSIIQTKDEFLETWASTVILDTEYYGMSYIKTSEYKVFKEFVGKDRVYKTPIHDHISKKNGVSYELEYLYPIVYGYGNN